MRKKWSREAFEKKFGSVEWSQNKNTPEAKEYEPEKDRAPKVVASGRGHVAERILDTAREHDIPVHQDAGLTKSLENVEIGEFIPPELYQVVAEVLVFVDSMDKIKGKWDVDRLKK